MENEDPVFQKVIEAIAYDELINHGFYDIQRAFEAPSLPIFASGFSRSQTHEDLNLLSIEHSIGSGMSGKIYVAIHRSGKVCAVKATSKRKALTSYLVFHWMNIFHPEWKNKDDFSYNYIDMLTLSKNGSTATTFIPAPSAMLAVS